MSWAPCQSCRRTDNGRLMYAYLSTFKGEERLSFRLRLCEACYVDIIPPFQEIADKQGDNGQWLTQEERAREGSQTQLPLATSESSSPSHSTAPSAEMRSQRRPRKSR